MPSPELNSSPARFTVPIPEQILVGISPTAPDDVNIRRYGHHDWIPKSGPPRYFMTEDPINDGGHAKIFLVWDRTVKRKLAAKKIDSANLYNPEYAHRLEREGRFLANLKHPGLPQVYDFFVFEDEPCLLMDYLSDTDSPTIKQLSKNRTVDRPYTTTDIIRVATDIGSVIDYLADHHILHNDIADGNISLPDTGHAKLIDFGITERLDDQGAFSAPKWKRAYNSYFCAPEAESSAFPLTRQSDIYSLGIVLYEMITREYPFPYGKFQNQHLTLEEGRPKRIANMPHMVQRYGMQQCELLDTFFMETLAVDPKYRPATGEEFGSTIHRILSNAPDLPTPKAQTYFDKLKARVSKFIPF